MIYKLLSLGLLMFNFSNALAAKVDVEINNSSTEIDDYICWSPTKVRVKLTSTETSSIKIRVNSKSNGTGQIQFAQSTDSSVAKTSLLVSPNLELNLEPSGNWTTFYVLGSKASGGDKDVSIEIKDSTGAVLATKPLMVRVRKNADSLSATERDQFLTALEQLHGLRRPVGHGQEFVKYAGIHDTAFNLGIHRADQGFPLFLAWHRAFLLSFERELQAIDPRVTMPYWRFDQDSQRIFSPNFMGSVSGPQTAGGVLVQFTDTNPIRDWNIRDDGRLRRVNNGDKSITGFTWDGTPNTSQMVLTLESIFASLGANTYGGALPRNGINSRFEFTHHNGAHARVDGWLGTGSSPRDPLFYLLHANVDRAWAQWQKLNSRFDKNSPDSYSLQGAYPGVSDPSRRIKSSYAQDGMWPWNLDDGLTTTDDPRDDWPSKGFAFPKSAIGFNPQQGAPKPSEMVDYMNILGSSEQIGMCYDDIEY